LQQVSTLWLTIFEGTVTLEDLSAQIHRKRIYAALKYRERSE
jgi:hypothetical protein